MENVFSSIWTLYSLTVLWYVWSCYEEGPLKENFENSKLELEALKLELLKLEALKEKKRIAVQTVLEHIQKNFELEYNNSSYSKFKWLVESLGFIPTKYAEYVNNPYWVWISTISKMVILLCITLFIIFLFAMLTSFIFLILYNMYFIINSFFLNKYNNRQIRIFHSIKSVMLDFVLVAFNRLNIIWNSFENIICYFFIFDIVFSFLRSISYFFIWLIKTVVIELVQSWKEAHPQSVQHINLKKKELIPVQKKKISNLKCKPHSRRIFLGSNYKKKTKL